MGVWLICSGLQGYMAGLGRLDSQVVRTLVSLGGLAIAMPQLNWVMTEPPSNLSGLILGGLMVAGALFLHRLTQTRQTA